MKQKIHTLAILLMMTVVLHCSTAYTQQYLHTERLKARQQLISYYAGYRYKSIMQETDSSITVQIRDSTVLPFSFILYFNQADICYAFKNLYYCDSCMRKALNYTLSSKKDNWQKITENFYISKYAKKMALTADTAAGKYYYTTTAMDWSRDDYKTAQQTTNVHQWIQQYKLQPPGEYQPDTANVIIWSARRLDWPDFKEEVFTDIYPGAKAKIHWNYRHSFGGMYKDSGKTKVTVQVYALCIPARSWVRPVNIGKKEVLVHEQLHFDIVELFARQLRQQLAQTAFTRDNYKNDINRAFGKSNLLMQQLQKEYDEGVKDDYGNARLAWWLADIADKIAVLDKYKNSSIAVTLYE